MTLAPKLWRVATSVLTLILCSLIPTSKVILTLYKYIYMPKQKFTKLKIGPKFFFSLNRIFLEVEHANLPKFARLKSLAYFTFCIWLLMHFVIGWLCLVCVPTVPYRRRHSLCPQLRRRPQLSPWGSLHILPWGPWRHRLPGGSVLRQPAARYNWRYKYL